MQLALPDTIVEDQELLPGGDLRYAGNSWLRKVWTDCNIHRVPREAEFRNVVAHIVAKNPRVCPLNAYPIQPTHAVQWILDRICGL